MIIVSTRVDEDIDEYLDPGRKVRETSTDESVCPF